MHDGTISQADTWLQNNLGAYIPYDLLRNAGQARSVWRDH
jgi:hypothetical protein